MRSIATILVVVVVTMLASRTVDVWADGYYGNGQDDIQSIAYDVLYPIPEFAAQQIWNLYTATGHDTGSADMCKVEPWHTMIVVSQLGFDPDC